MGYAVRHDPYARLMASKQYQVVGSHAVDGHTPGSRFTAELDPWREEVLIGGGHIRVVEKASKETDDEE